MLKNIKIKNIDIRYLRKILSKKGFLLSKKSAINKQSSLQNLYKISLASQLMISFFYILPPSYKFLSKLLTPNQEIQNSSNQKLVQVLEGNFTDVEINDEKNGTDQDLVYQELYGEVTEEDSLESGSSMNLS